MDNSFVKAKGGGGKGGWRQGTEGGGERETPAIMSH